MRLLVFLFCVLAAAYAGAAPDPRYADAAADSRDAGAVSEKEAYDRLMRTLSAYSALIKQQTLADWCKRQYPQTSDLADRMQGYLAPRIEKVETFLYSEARHPKVKEIMDEIEDRLDKEHSEMQAGYASSYNAQRCERALHHWLEKGMGAQIESFIDS